MQGAIPVLRALQLLAQPSRQFAVNLAVLYTVTRQKLNYSPFAPSISYFLNFKLPIERRP